MFLVLLFYYVCMFGNIFLYSCEVGRIEIMVISNGYISVFENYIDV